MLRLAKLLSVNPQAHTADILMLDTGDRIPNVEVLAADVTTNSGALGLALPTAPSSPYDPQPTGERDVYAYVAFAGRIPKIIGFKVPEVGQMTFAEAGLKIARHGSDVYSTVSDDGSFEMAWPNGLWMGVQTRPGHVDRTGKDFDGQWSIRRNKDAQYYVTMSLPGGAGQLQIDPQGNATLALKRLSLQVDGAIDSSAQSWTHNGPMTVAGHVGVSGNVDVSGDVTAADCIGGGVSLATQTLTI